MDWFENRQRECAGGAREPHPDAVFGWEFQCGDNASHSSQLPLEVRCPVSDTPAKPASPFGWKPGSRAVAVIPSAPHLQARDLGAAIRAGARKLRILFQTAPLPQSGSIVRLSLSLIFWVESRSARQDNQPAINTDLFHSSENQICGSRVRCHAYVAPWC
jgi:hypothetical protein